MCRPQASASKAMRMPRLAARSPSSRRSAAARSMPPSDSGAEFLHDVELAFGAIHGPFASSGRQALEVAERLQGDDVQPERRARPPHVRRRTVEGYKVVLEDLDRIELGGGNGFELLAQCAAERYRGNRG